MGGFVQCTVAILLAAAGGVLAPPYRRVSFDVTGVAPVWRDRLSA
jgi:hypothetical protein